MNKIITKLQLQGCHSANDAWGIFTTIPIDEAPVDSSKALKAAYVGAEKMRNRWLGNYDPTLQFRIIEL